MVLPITLVRCPRAPRTRLAAWLPALLMPLLLTLGGCGGSASEPPPTREDSLQQEIDALNQVIEGQLTALKEKDAALKELTDLNAYVLERFAAIQDNNRAAKQILASGQLNDAEKAKRLYKSSQRYLYDMQRRLTEYREANAAMLDSNAHLAKQLTTVSASLGDAQQLITDLKAEIEAKEEAIAKLEGEKAEALKGKAEAEAERDQQLEVQRFLDCGFDYERLGFDANGNSWGRGGRQDRREYLSKAIRCYTQAANLGNDEAQARLKVVKEEYERIGGE